MKKKHILLNPIGGSQWIGGLYYLKNVLFGLLQNESLKSNFNFTILTEEKNKDIFSSFDKSVKIYFYKDKWKLLAKVLAIFKVKKSFVFPIANPEWHLSKLGKYPIYWIPDFQHNLFPEFFDTQDSNQRTDAYTKIAESSYPLVLSSQSAKKDFEKFYPNKKNVYVMSFVSYIEPEIRMLTPSIEEEVLQKFELVNKQYTCISNQFWQHKNHIIVAKAIRELNKIYPEDKLKFVFTGELKDYRNTEYYQKLMSLFSEQDIRESSVILGFINRIEQLVLMKHAKFIIQPSLFEGWGTVLEDAKVLDKLVLLSDIPIHREQKNENCILFDPYKEEALAECIHKALHIERQDNIEKGIKQMYKSAADYSLVFQQMLIDYDRKKN